MSYQLTLTNDIIIDNFAGGGGASCGIEMALGRPVDVAVNHDAYAIGMHTINHPTTVHHCQDVYAVNPYEVCAGRKIRLAHFSPDCKHFSKAKGSALVDKNIRDLAWVVHRYTCLPDELKPAVISLENVEEFLTWGPLTEDGKPDPARKGEEFNRWLQVFYDNGYVVEWQIQRACDYSDTATIRKRLFLIARSDGEDIVWPEKTHADPKKIAKGAKMLPHATAAECIDWSLPCPSIMGRKRPLKPNTLKRIARGMRKFVLEADEPFILNLTHGGRLEPAFEPLRTTTCAKRGEKAIIVPYLAGCGGRAGQSPERSVDAPAGTVTAKADTVMVTPLLVHTAHGERDKNGKKRGKGEKELNAPLPTVTASQDCAVVMPYFVGAGGPAYGGKPTHSDQPFKTLTTENHSQIVVPFLAQHNGGFYEGPGRGADTPLSTITASGKQQGIVAASFVSKFYGTTTGSRMDEPLHSVTADGLKHAHVRAMLVKYYGNEKEGHDVTAPLGTITTKDRFGLVQVESMIPEWLTDEQRYNAWALTRFLEEYGAIDVDESPIPSPRPAMIIMDGGVMVDIGMRMLAPRELARAQGFPDTYIIEYALMVDKDGNLKKVPLTKTQQVNKIGNSVCPKHLAANLRPNIPRGGVFSSFNIPQPMPYQHAVM